ncbi:hypothetical protein K9L63_01645 [Candidatus Gracilibacteria bacterium]|nr:hypothetical protein [Candidatus Gracilibacteria bacterium]
MKLKNSGITLLISLGISFLSLSIAMAVLSSIRQATEQNTSIERSNQVFYAAESGLEAAFFHHNARGRGVHFVEDPESQEVDASQKISLPSNSAEVEWKILGRTSPIVGMLKEGQSIEIPFFWDNSANPTDSPPRNEGGNFDPSHLNAGKFVGSFALQLYNQVEDGGGDMEQAVFDAYGPFEFPIGFDFGSTDTEVFLGWSLERISADSDPETFVPRAEGDPCSIDSELLCEDEFPLTLSSNDPLDGNILPGNEEAVLDSFWGDGEKYVLTFRPFLPFSSTEGTPDNPDDDTHIAGIPFSIDTDETFIPKNFYTVTSAVNIGEYQKTISVEVPETISVGAFDYVIFE